MACIRAGSVDVLVLGDHELARRRGRSAGGSPFISTNSTTMAAIAIHAPCVNLVTSTTTSTSPVTTAPKALITRVRTHPAGAAGSVSVRSSRVQCRTMPVWLSVKETNTPTM